MKILITGGNGFIGKNLARLLKQSEKDEIFIGTHSLVTGENFINFPFDNVALMDFELASHNFDIIYHLASQSSVYQSIQQPFDTFELNVTGALSLLQLVSKKYNKIKLIFTSSAQIYKTGSEKLSEEIEIQAKSPYALSKLFIDSFIRMSAEKIKLNAIIIRQFNTIGAGQRDSFVMSSFAKQLAGMKVLDNEKKMSVGNLEVFRDFLDVKDTVRAYKILKSADVKTGEIFNVCSGKAIEIKECLNKMIEISGISDVKVEIDPLKYRKDDLKVLCGDNRKIKALGWEPLIPIEQTFKEMLEYWEDKLMMEREQQC